MGCECQRSQTRGCSIGVFISSCVLSPLTEAEALLRLEMQPGRIILPICPPWGLTHPLLHPPCSGGDLTVVPDALQTLPRLAEGAM